MFIVTECGDAFVVEGYKVSYEGNISVKAREGAK